jgi:hypothetical protein
LNVGGNLAVTGKLSASGNFSISAVNGTIAVDGITYPLTAAGVQAAITACQTTSGCTAVDARQVQNITLGTLTFATKAIRFQLGSVGQNSITPMMPRRFDRLGRCGGLCKARHRKLSPDEKELNLGK